MIWRGGLFVSVASDWMLRRWFVLLLLLLLDVRLNDPGSGFERRI